MKHSARKLAVVIALLLGVLAGCGPEATRQQGAGFGTGADVGNHAGTPEEINPRSKVFNTEEGQP